MLPTQNTLVHIMASISCSLCNNYAKAVSFIGFHMDFCICDDILDTILIVIKKLLLYKISKLGQILHVALVSAPIPFECNHLNIELQVFLRSIQTRSKRYSILDLDTICVGASAPLLVKIQASCCIFCFI